MLCNLTRVSETIQKPPLVKAQTALSKKQKKIKYWRKTIFNMADGILTTCIVARSWHWFRLKVVSRHHSSKLLNFWENGVFAFWHQDPRWQISTILDFRGPIIGSLKSPCATSYRSSINTVALNCLSLRKSHFFAFWRQDPSWQISAILDFYGPIMGSLKNPRTTSYRLSIDTIAVNCLVFWENNVFFCILATDRQTDRETNRQINSIDAVSRSRCRERRLKKTNMNILWSSILELAPHPQCTWRQIGWCWPCDLHLSPSICSMVLPGCNITTNVVAGLV